MDLETSQPEHGTGSNLWLVMHTKGWIGHRIEAIQLIEKVSSHSCNPHKDAHDQEKEKAGQTVITFSSVAV